MNWLARLVSKRVRELEEEVAFDKKYEAKLIERVGEAELKLKSRESTPFAKTVAGITIPVDDSADREIDHYFAGKEKPGVKLQVLKPKTDMQILMDADTPIWGFDGSVKAGYLRDRPKPKGDMVWREDVERALMYVIRDVFHLPNEKKRVLYDAIDSIPAAESHDVLAHKPWHSKCSICGGEITEDISVGTADGIAHEKCFHFRESEEKSKLIADLRERIRIRDEKIARFEREYSRAKRTLEGAGYTDQFGEFWKPPLGPKPNHLLKRIEELEQQLAEAYDASMMSNASHEYTLESARDRIAELEQQLSAREQALKDALKKEEL